MLSFSSSSLPSSFRFFLYFHILPMSDVTFSKSMLLTSTEYKCVLDYTQICYGISDKIKHIWISSNNEESKRDRANEQQHKEFHQFKNIFSFSLSDLCFCCSSSLTWLFPFRQKSSHFLLFFENWMK